MPGVSTERTVTGAAGSSLFPLLEPGSQVRSLDQEGFGVLELVTRDVERATERLGGPTRA
jgi:hypothetical protein